MSEKLRKHRNLINWIIDRVPKLNMTVPDDVDIMTNYQIKSAAIEKKIIQNRNHLLEFNNEKFRRFD